MSIKDTVNNAWSNWMEGTGPDDDVVISSRIRLARNMTGYPFPHFMSDQELEQVAKVLQLAVTKIEPANEKVRLEYANLSELTVTERQILVEKHLVSPQHIEKPAHRGVAIALDESISIMVNEEDHIRIQCLLPGLQLNETLNLANQIDDLLEQTLDYCFCEKRGYLTSCPTNVGTGMRASVMLHLPCLVITKQVGKLVNAISQLGLAARGYYGEGTEAYGNLFQVSNQVTMGQTEEEIVRNLITVTKQIIAQERVTREGIFKENRAFLEDKVFRAFGAMRYARRMTSQEALKGISELRLGVELGFLDKITYQRINELIILTRPAFLEKDAGRQLNQEERNLLRADVLREKLSDIKID